MVIHLLATTAVTFQKGGKKYFKRGYLSAKREEEYYAIRAKLDKKEKSPSLEKNISENQQPSEPDGEEQPDTSSSKPVLSRKEVSQSSLLLFGLINCECFYIQIV